MGDYFPSLRKRVIRFLGLLNWKSRLKEVRRVKKVIPNAKKLLAGLRSRYRWNLGVRVNSLIFFILVLAMRLFFYSSFWGDEARAEQINPIKKTSEIGLEMIDPMAKIKNDSREENLVKKQAKICGEDNLNIKNKTRSNLDEAKICSLMAGHPIEEMIPFIIERDKKTALFLIAIAKKESDWGKHIPTKNGKNCYNYWGYKGGYNLTQSGYSCFDSAEQAISVVGDRIDELVEENIDTPQEMLVWKCGYSCAGHDPCGVKKWVWDVDLYYNKLNS